MKFIFMYIQKEKRPRNLGLLYYTNFSNSSGLNPANGA